VRSGRHLWAQRFDRDLKELFDLQDEIAKLVVQELEVQMLDGEHARFWHGVSRDPRAVDYFRQGRALFVRTGTWQGALEARRLFEQAAALDPSFIFAHAFVAIMSNMALYFGLPSDHAACLASGRAALDRVAALDADSPELLLGRSVQSVIEGRAAEAVEIAQRCVSLAPNSGGAWALLALAHLNVGHYNLALSAYEKAFALAPDPPVVWTLERGSALFRLERYEEALASYATCAAAQPESLPAYLFLAATYAALGRTSEAETQARIANRLLGSGSLHDIARWIMPYQDPAPRERFVALMTGAGVK